MTIDILLVKIKKVRSKKKIFCESLGEPSVFERRAVFRTLLVTHKKSQVEF